MIYDVLIIGGGPAGLSAALTLGRGRRHVLLCDAGPPRNAAAEHVQTFVTRDGIPPREFRRIAREQLAPYATVEYREARVEQIRGERGAFEVRLATGEVRARRVLLCTGMIDQLLELDGFRALWGKSIFQCPYCHGWEHRDLAFGVLATTPELLELAILVRGWTSRVVALTHGAIPLAEDVRDRLLRARVQIDERPILRLTARDDRLHRVEFAHGDPLPLDVLFSRPPQKQVPIVESLGLALDPAGYVQVDARTRETSRPGIFAAGDLLTPVQGAVLSAASGMLAGAAVNHSLVAELAAAGALG